MHSRIRAALFPLLFVLTAASPAELQQWKKQADRVTITRDDWGIAHVHGKTDADAVFGMIYAQAEDDFPRIEANYLTNLGRTAEADGEKAIWQDLRARLYVSEDGLKANYAASPDWLKKLMTSWAAGLNYYLATHSDMRPRVLTRFEPWMALSFTEGSIGGDIERIDLGDLQKFYAGRKTFAAAAPDPEPRGSNGIAIAPSIAAGGNSLLLINPHTSFFFRSELQVTSDEGLNAYGAATWGQFFVYQGFNERTGWMHTSSGVDNVDEFAVDVRQPELGPRYRYGKDWRPMQERRVAIRYRKADGTLGSRNFITWRTHQGPIVRADSKGHWIAFAMMDKPVAALQQSFLRTKTRDLKDFLKVADLKANSSNNTVFADSRGEIAMLMPQFMPRRNDRFDYTKPVDGSDPATDWGPLHPIAELPNAINPPNGWVHNENNWPYRAAGPNSPDPARFPKYMDMFGENYRGMHALQLLSGSKGWTLERLQAAAFDSYQPGFAELIPSLIKAYDALPRRDARRERLGGPIGMLRTWNYRWAAGSVPQSLAMFWVDGLMKAAAPPSGEPINVTTTRLVRDTSDAQKLAALSDALARLRRDFGWWQVPWGEINRFQRISPAIDHPFSDASPSIPVAFPSARWGSLASFGATPKPGTRRWYGTSGNSFVAVVEFGRRVRARAVTAGGESGNPASKHFNDEAERYATGNLREVYFYPDQLSSHTERRYKPGG
ncbi:MAG: acylase [Sphingomonas sp.]|nr:acylase [Sphingomonas sp.]